MLATEHTETNLDFSVCSVAKRKVKDAAILRNRLVCDPLRIGRGSLPGKQEQIRVPDLYDGQLELGDIRFDRRQLGDRFWEYDLLLHASPWLFEMAAR